MDGDFGAQAGRQASGGVAATGESGKSTLSGHPMANLPVHDARVLTSGGAQAVLSLDGTPYILRITRAGKLILTK